MKRFISVFLAAVLVFSFIPAAAVWAQDSALEPDGSTWVQPGDTLGQGGFVDNTQTGETGDAANMAVDVAGGDTGEGDASGQAADEKATYSTMAEAEDAGAIVAAPDNPEAYVEGEILVVLAGEASLAQETVAVEESILAITELNETVETEAVTSEPDGGSTILVELPEDVSVADALLQMANDEHVAFAQPNFTYHLLDEGTPVEAGEAEAAPFAKTSEVDPLFVPNDPSVIDSSQWWLAKVNALTAWDMQRTDGAVTVAVVDTGARLTHQDLAANILQNLAWDAYNKQPLALSVSKELVGYGGDDSGHGTHVSGIVAAVANNSIAGAGVSYNAKLLPINVFYLNSEKKLIASTSTVRSAYDYIIKHQDEVNIRVVNMSLGGYQTPTNNADDTMLHNWIIEAQNAGILTVCAGGNSGDKPDYHVDENINNDTFPTYPADYEECISVTNVTQSNVINSASDHNASKDIAAPGTSILSTNNSNDTATTYQTGSSMSSPIVAGIVALMFARNPTLTPNQVKTYLYQSATDLGATGKDTYYGYGLVNAKAALDLIPKDDFNNAIVVFASALDKSKGLDIPGLSMQSTVQANLWTLGQRPNQRFRLAADTSGYYTITNVNSNLLLDVSGGLGSNGAKVIQYPANGGNNQKWKLVQNSNGSYTILSKLNENLCLDLFTGGSANGTPLIVWQRGTNKGNQQFFLTKVTPALSNGTYTMQSEATGRMLDIEGASTKNLAPAISWVSNNGANQRFTFTYNQQTGYYKITTFAGSTKALDVSGASAANGALVIQYDSSNAYNQQWYVEKAANGNYVLFAAHSGLVLDLKGGVSANGTSVITWNPNGGANQRWVLAAA